MGNRHCLFVVCRQLELLSRIDGCSVYVVNSKNCFPSRRTSRSCQRYKAFLHRRRRNCLFCSGGAKGFQNQWIESKVEGRTLLYLANTKTQVGTITTCNDSRSLPDSAIMFPLRLQHSLHLITGQNLPQKAMASNMPHLDKHYADPRQALRAHEVFVTGFNVRYGTYSREH